MLQPFMKLQFASQLLSNCPFNDATLEFSDGSLSISRMILASHCKQFYDLFSENPNKDHFKCKNLKLCDFKIYYEYLHLDAEFIIDGAKLVSLMKVHAALNISDLMEKLNKWMVTENFASYLNYFFDQNTNNEVHKEQSNLARKFILQNLKSLCIIKAFERFSRDNFFSLLSNKFIKLANQDVLFQIIGQWVNHDFNTRKTDWLSLVRKLDFANITYFTIDTCMKENKNTFLVPELSQFFWVKMKEIMMKKNPLILSKSSWSKMILFGGKNAIDSVVEINIKKSSVKRISQLSIGKAHHCSERIGDYVFVLGDANNSQIENFDLEQMKWYNTSTLLQSFRDHDSVIVDRTIYVVGDYESKKFQRFDRREGKWSFLVDIPENAYYTSMSSWEQKITCIGGGIKARLMGQVYDIRNDKWEQIENLPIFIYGAKSLESESHIIVAGGYGTDKIHSYDKSKKIWSNLNIKLPKENWNVSKVLI
uniref:BTB domain-containing protein n=1 Tax=Rhabditophanes sp. KR3021 TaxID=114890 RepID=A0AC35UE66_9BILA